MTEGLKVFVPIAGRILMGSFFFISGVQKAIHFSSYESFLRSISQFQSYATNLAVAIIAFEILFGILLIVDIKTRVVSLLLSLYLIFISLALILFVANYNILSFVQSLAIVGGLLQLATYASTARASWKPFT